MLFCLLNDSLFPCPRTHALHVRKLAEGFIQHGYHYKEVSSDELQYLSETDVLYISNHFSTEPVHRFFKETLQKRLMSLLLKVKSSLVLWNFHTTNDWNILKTLGVRVIHLGEDLYPLAIQAEPLLCRFRQDFHVLPLRYSSPLHPHLSECVHLKKEFDFNFVGHGYQREMTIHCEQNYQSLIRNTPPTVSEVLRVNAFRRAQVNLVFHATSNIAKGVVVERFPEALSLGGIVFHDHPRISAEFSGHPALFFVTTPSDIDQAFAFVMNRSETERNSMRAASWESWRQSGLSYFDQAGMIIASLKKNVEMGKN